MADNEVTEVRKALDILAVLADPKAAKEMLQDAQDALMDAEEAAQAAKASEKKAVALAEEARKMELSALKALEAEKDLALRRADESHALAEARKSLDGELAVFGIQKASLLERESRLKAWEADLADKLKEAQLKLENAALLEASWKEKITTLKQLAG